jgi:hypothetical protein
MIVLAYLGSLWTKFLAAGWSYWFREGSESRPKKARLVKSKVKRTLIIFFHIKELVQKEFVLAGQTVNSVYYCDVLRLLSENVWRLRSEIWRQNNWLLHHDNAPSHISFYNREILTKEKQLGCSPHPPYFSLFPRLKTKLKRSHFDTTEVIEADSQAMLNTFIEHNFQDAF